MGRRLSDLWLVRFFHFHAMKNLTRLAVEFEASICLLNSCTPGFFSTHTQLESFHCISCLRE